MSWFMLALNALLQYSVLTKLVTIIMNEQIALKIFNRELKAAAAFMTGQIKARGDLAKVGEVPYIENGH